MKLTLHDLPERTGLMRTSDPNSTPLIVLNSHFLLPRSLRILYYITLYCIILYYIILYYIILYYIILYYIILYYIILYHDDLMNT